MANKIDYEIFVPQKETTHGHNQYDKPYILNMAHWYVNGSKEKICEERIKR